MGADKPPQIRPDLAWGLKPGSLRGFFLLLDRNVGALRIMFQIAKHANREQVPGCALIANEDEVLRLSQRLGIGILHLTLLIEITKFSRQRNEHLYVKISSAGKRLAQIGQSRPISKQVLLPRNVCLEFFIAGSKRVVGFLALGHALRLVELRVAANREENQQVPVITLAVSHPQRRLVAGPLISRRPRFVEINQLQQLSRRRLYQCDLVEILIGCGLSRQSAD